MSSVGKSAMENPAEEIHFRQFHLCYGRIPVRWMPMDKWDACAGCRHGCRRQAVLRGLDLSSRSI